MKESIRKLWAEVFGDTADYLAMYFDRVYREEDAMTVCNDGKLDSALLLQPYKMQYQGRDVPVSYICGAMTRRQARGRGYMRSLIRKALAVAHDRGDMLTALIPAHDWLYFFYDKMGFSTVFYVDVQRFTSLHTFTPEGSWTPVTDPYSPAVIEAFERLQRERPCTMLHTKRDFLNILDDNRLDGGNFVAMAADDGHVAALAWAVPDVKAGLLTVTELMGESHDAREGALARLRELHPGMAFKVLAPPLREGRHFNARGMARVTNVMTALGAVAAAHPMYECTLRITDRLLPQNDGLYRIASGTVEHLPASTAAPRVDFDVDVETLASVLFSGPKIADVIEFPSQRPVLSLMLE